MLQFKHFSLLGTLRADGMQRVLQAIQVKAWLATFGGAALHVHRVGLQQAHAQLCEMSAELALGCQRQWLLQRARMWWMCSKLHCCAEF